MGGLDGLGNIMVEAKALVAAAFAAALLARRGYNVLKIIIGLVAALPQLEADVQGVVNEVKDAPFGLSMLKNAILALRKLADDIEAALS